MQHLSIGRPGYGMSHDSPLHFQSRLPPIPFSKAELWGRLLICGRLSIGLLAFPENFPPPRPLSLRGHLSPSPPAALPLPRTPHLRHLAPARQPPGESHSPAAEHLRTSLRGDGPASRQRPHRSAVPSPPPHREHSSRSHSS